MKNSREELKTLISFKEINFIASILFLTISSLVSYSQSLPCRDWYYVEDRNGNKIKDKCMVAWQENDIGQKDGKYIYYKENGTPLEVIFYKAGIAHGRYVLYADNNEAILDSGRYVNGKKSGKWIHDGNNFVTYNNDKPVSLGTRKYSELQLTGAYDQTGSYTGKILLHEKTTSPMTLRRNIFTPFTAAEWMRDALDTRIMGKYDYTLPFPVETCRNCVKDFPEEILKRVYEQFSRKDYVFLVGNVSNGSIKVTELQVWVNGKPLSNSKEKINELVSAIENEKNELATQDRVNEEKKKRDESGESMLDAKKFGLDPISFQTDSYEPDVNGINSIQKVVSFLKDVDHSTINRFIIIGHAVADKELGKVVFDPKNEGVLYKKDGKQTQLSEADLANLRMILSLGRAKSVFRAIEDLPITKELINGKKVFLLPAGTLFGDRLVTNSIDQNVVQIVILTNDGHEINTLSKALPFGTNFKESVILTDVNNLIRALNYNFSKFIPAFLGANTFGSPLPNYIELATKPNSLAHFTNQYR